MGGTFENRTYGQNNYASGLGGWAVSDTITGQARQGAGGQAVGLQVTSLLRRDFRFRHWPVM